MSKYKHQPAPLPPEDDDDKEANKLNHIFNKTEHKLDDFLNKFENNQQQAYNAIIKEFEKDMANGELPNNFTNGHKVNIKGYEITVRGVIKNGKPKIGTMFILRQFYRYCKYRS
nr:hypothetical protein [uncultured Campylobacter sp.]